MVGALGVRGWVESKSSKRLSVPERVPAASRARNFRVPFFTRNV